MCKRYKKKEGYFFFRGEYYKKPKTPLDDEMKESLLRLRQKGFPPESLNHEETKKYYRVVFDKTSKCKMCKSVVLKERITEGCCFKCFNKIKNIILERF